MRYSRRNGISSACAAHASWTFTVTSRTEPHGTVGTPMHDGGVIDEQPAPPTVLDRLIAAGLSEARIEQHMGAERVRLDGELVTDLAAPAPAGTRVVIWTG